MAEAYTGVTSISDITRQRGTARNRTTALSLQNGPTYAQATSISLAVSPARQAPVRSPLRFAGRPLLPATTRPPLGPGRAVERTTDPGDRVRNVSLGWVVALRSGFACRYVPLVTAAAIGTSDFATMSWADEMISPAVATIDPFEPSAPLASSNMSGLARSSKERVLEAANIDLE
jgi:hypothetical protein